MYSLSRVFWRRATNIEIANTVSRFVYILKESIPKIPIKVAGSQGGRGRKKANVGFFQH